MPDPAADPERTPLLQKILRMLREEVDPAYEFRSLGPIPWTTAGALGQARVALVTTAGLHLRGDAPFRAAEQRLGDTTFRLVPHATQAVDLDLAAVYVDQKLVARDPEVALPMSALERLVSRGKVGSAAARHASFCGGIVRPLPGLAESAERLVPILAEDRVGGVVLLPTCSLCVQTTCVLAREIESRGLPTVAISLLPELSRILGAPRTLAVRFPFGAPCGEPMKPTQHDGVLLEALELLERQREPGAIVASRHAWRRG